MLIVGGVLQLVAEQVGDRRAVRAPRQPSRLLGRGRRQPRGLRAGARLDDEEVAVRRLVDVAFPVPPDERDPLAVRRPGRRLLVEGARRERLRLLRRDVEQIEVRALAAEISVDVRLEVVAIDDDRLRRLGRIGLRRFLVFWRIGGIGILDDEDETLAVGRPGVVGNAALDVRQLDGFAAGAVQQPDLRVLRALAGRDERRDTCRRGSSGAGTRSRESTSPGSAACHPSSPSRRRCRSCRCLESRE